MNIHILSSRQKEKLPFLSFVESKNCTAYVESSISKLFQNAGDQLGHLFILEADLVSLSQTLDCIKDIRAMFGAFPMVLVIADKEINSSLFLNIGADHVFAPPIDLNIFEDILHKKLRKSNFLPIHYRTVPSGGSPTKLRRKIFVIEISSVGAKFVSRDFLIRGMTFEFPIRNLIETSYTHLLCKVVSSEQEESHFLYTVEFQFQEESAKKELRFHLKKISS